MKLALGTWLSIGSPVIAELAAQCGFDWVLLDLEHGCGTEATILPQIQAIRGTATSAIVRVGAPHPELIARVLDWGAHGIMVPHVNSAAEAEGIVRATPRMVPVASPARSGPTTMACAPSRQSDLPGSWPRSKPSKE